MAVPKFALKFAKFCNSQSFGYKLQRKMFRGTGPGLFSVFCNRVSVTLNMSKLSLSFFPLFIIEVFMYLSYRMIWSREFVLDSNSLSLICKKFLCFLNHNYILKNEISIMTYVEMQPR